MWEALYEKQKEQGEALDEKQKRFKQEKQGREFKGVGEEIL